MSSLTPDGGQSKNGYALRLADDELPNAKVVRNLRILVDSKFSSEHHYLKVVGEKVCEFSVLFSKGSKYVCRVSGEITDFVYALPLLDYCCQLFPFIMKKVKLVSVQRFFAKRLYGHRLSHELCQET